MMLPWLQVQSCASSFVEQLAAGWGPRYGEMHSRHGRCSGQSQALPIWAGPARAMNTSCWDT